ncbi:MAG: tetratricopeptide repeat protein [Gemmatimonadales bacterium]
MSQRSYRSRAALAGVVLASLAGYGSAAGQGDGKIPITTTSAEAKRQYVKGRALAENLRGHDSRQFLGQAVSRDPKFALAHYSLALSAPTAKDFFEHLKQAAALSDNATEGEHLMILGLQAGANADPKAQRDYYQRLVAAYPRDERAHFLLGGAYFGQQDMPKAIQEYRRAVEVAPDFAPAYNLLGYAERQVGAYGEAERAFKKYIELIPDDPNPYDSYAELLMKTGRFDASIGMYRKALAADRNFVPSHIGIATNLMLQGKHDAARAETWKVHQAARNDGDRRGALFTAAVIYADEGKFDQALAELQKEYAVAEKINDAAAMSADVVAMGDVLLEAGKPEEARKRYLQAVELVQQSDLSEEVKQNNLLAHHYNLGRVASRAADLAGARQHATTYMNGATARKNDPQIKQAHELMGTIALAEKNFDQAIAELSKGNQQDAYTLYRLAWAYQEKGDAARASELFQQVANQNTLPALNYSFVRAKAKKMKV